MGRSPVRWTPAIWLLFVLLMLAVQACGVLPQTGPPDQNVYTRRR